MFSYSQNSALTTLPVASSTAKQKHELRSILSEPPMVAAVYLYQHSLTRHPLTTNTVFRWTTTARTVDTGSDQYASQRVTGYVYTITFSQQFAQMSVVDS